MLGTDFNPGRECNVFEAVNGIKQDSESNELSARSNTIVHRRYHRSQGDMVTTEKCSTTTDQHENREHDALSRHAKFTEVGNTQLY